MELIKMLFLFLFLFIFTLIIPKAAALTAQCLTDKRLGSDILTQLFQGSIALALLKMISGKPCSQIGFQFGDAKQGFREFLIFAFVWTGIVLTFYLVCLQWMPWL